MGTKKPVTEFPSWQSFWNFARKRKYASRYILDDESEIFLKTLIDTCSSRIETVPKGINFWRAQLGNGWRPIEVAGDHIDDEPVPHNLERMKPRIDRATEGRANAKGIPVLYMSTNKETALAEVRPWIGAYISVAQMHLSRDLRIVNCTLGHDGVKIFLSLSMEEPPSEMKEKSVWAQIDKAFSEPITPSDDVADYVSTQIISELFRENGYDGIAYRSSLGEGYNLALFDVSVAIPINCFLHKLNSINFDFGESVTNPIFSKEHYRGDSSTPKN